ncbi:hypothetical protein ACB092_03G087600 [Castanea dentata]
MFNKLTYILNAYTDLHMPCIKKGIIYSLFYESSDVELYVVIITATRIKAS